MPDTIQLMTSPDCSHVDTIVADVAPSSNGCEDCLLIGTTWMHLRRCMWCGHVGCCDSSPMRHATAHFHEMGHPIVQSFEPGEDWLWCYVDDVGFEIESMMHSPAHT
jgi:uncharacterized UBP type Zn finger protein